MGREPRQILGPEAADRLHQLSVTDGQGRRPVGETERGKAGYDGLPPAADGSDEALSAREVPKGARLGQVTVVGDSLAPGQVEGQIGPEGTGDAGARTL